MEKIAGPYLHTLTGTLGDKRSTMLESELQYTVGITVHLCNCARDRHLYQANSYGLHCSKMLFRLTRKQTENYRICLHIFTVTFTVFCNICRGLTVVCCCYGLRATLRQCNDLPKSIIQGGSK